MDEKTEISEETVFEVQSKKFFRSNFSICVVFVITCGLLFLGYWIGVECAKRYYSTDSEAERNYYDEDIRKDISSTGGDLGSTTSQTLSGSNENVAPTKKQDSLINGQKIFEDVDVNSLTLLASGTGWNIERSESSVYCNRKQSDPVDLPTFKVIEGGVFSKDKEFVYTSVYSPCPKGGRFFKMLPHEFVLDVETFEHFGGRYYYDKNDVYKVIYYIETEDMIALGADPSTFELLEGGFSRDKDYLYYANNGTWSNALSVKFENSHPDSFEKIASSSYAKDKNQVYYGQNKYEGFTSYTVVAGADPQTFQVLTEFPEALQPHFGMDNNTVFLGDSVVDFLDRETVKTYDKVQVLISDKDGLYMYWPGLDPKLVKLESVDPASFAIDRVTDQGVVYGSDKNVTYKIQINSVGGSGIESFHSFEKTDVKYTSPIETFVNDFIRTTSE